ncbi:MAG: trigger factor [Spirochaetaceae bacterium]|nr:trigger factor [Spirochaetaceae bacterium]
MATTKKITRLEKSAVRLEVTVPQDDLRVAYEKEVGDITRTVQIPGFRKGKVPRNVLERKLGAALKEDVFNSIVGETVRGIIEDETFPKELIPLPYSSPILEEDDPAKKSPADIDFGSDLVFSVKWDASPVVAVESWKGFSVEVPDVAVEDADVARELERIRERNAMVMDRPVEETARYGDIVTVTYAEVDAHFVTVSGTNRENHVFTLGSLENYYQLDEDIVGMQAGDTKIIERDFPEDFPAKELAGTKKNIRIQVTALKEKRLPELDDDLAQDIHERFKTLDDLKKEIRQSLAYNLAERLDEWKFAVILNQIAEKNPVDLPESMIQYDVDTQIMNLCQMQGMKEEQILKVMSGKNQAYQSVAEARRPDTVKSLQFGLIQQKLVEMLKIEVSDKDRDAEFKAIAGRQNLDVAQVEDHYKQEERKVELDDYLMTRKLREALFTENTVNTGAKQSFEEFMGGTAK